MTKAYSSNLTSYDLLKTFAVIIMVIDHIGFYFFPDMLWWRAVGRIGFPIWFFLVGYSRGRDIPIQLWGGGFVLLAGNLITGMSVFPLNALFTIMGIRLVIDWFMKRGFEKSVYIWSFSIVLMLVVLPSYYITEYGTQALITAIYGYYVRYKDEAGKQAAANYMLFSFFTFIAYQQLVYDFDIWEFVFMFIGTLIVRLTLLDFSSKVYPRLTERLPCVAVWFFQLCGRHTLRIYIVHLLAFKFMAAAMGYEGFNWFEIEMIPSGLVEDLGLCLKNFDFGQY
ncbi:MAG: hypothetical protein KAJ29_07980 [Alphaproteobacteria bacterium]|nr:hypothetical protein [Alphaproteobacteria bacterium]